MIVTCGGISKAASQAKAAAEGKAKAEAEPKAAADAEAKVEKAAAEKPAAKKAADDAKVVMLENIRHFLCLYAVLHRKFKGNASTSRDWYFCVKTTLFSNARRRSQRVPGEFVLVCVCVCVCVCERESNTHKTRTRAHARANTTHTHTHRCHNTTSKR